MQIINKQVNDYSTHSSGGISGKTLKWIAIITMFIDHVAASMFMYTPSCDFFISFAWSTSLYYLMRSIGRIAFPLFAFCLVEGFVHTSNRGKQLRNLIVFGIISQLPYYYCLCTSSSWDFNIMFTLAYCYMMLIFLEWLLGKLGIRIEPFRHPVIASFLVNLEVLFIAVITGLLFGFCSLRLKLDYNWGAVFMVLGFYIFRKTPEIAATVGIGALLIFMIFTGSSTFILTLVVAWGCILRYNGTRGRQNKWFFYLFYPIHISLIFLARYLVFG